MQYIELLSDAAFLLCVNIITASAGLHANWCWNASILPRMDSHVELIDFAVVVMKSTHY